MTAPNRCGAQIYRCSECGTAVAPSRVRKGETCPRHEGAEVVDGYCEKRIAPGRLRCSKHGAGAPQVRSADGERRLEADVEQLLADREIQPVTNPLEALQRLLGEVVAVKDAFADRVDELRHLTTVDQLGREDVRALLSAYERALDRAGKLLVDASRLNIDERLVAVNQRISEDQGHMLGRIIKAITEHDAVPSDLRHWLNKSIATILRSAAAAGGGFDALDRSLSSVEAPDFKIVIVRPDQAIEVRSADLPEAAADDAGDRYGFDGASDVAVDEPVVTAEPPVSVRVDDRPPAVSSEPEEPSGVSPRGEPWSPHPPQGDPWARKRVDPHTPSGPRLWW